MSPDFDTHDGEATEEIVDEFIKFVTKSDDELAKEAKTNKQQKTELKIYLAEDRGFEPENLNQRITDLITSDETNKYPRSFFEEHNFEIQPLNDETYHLVISTPRYERDDDFILINSGGYLKALTVIRKSWAEDTIEKFIKYLPGLERIFLTSGALEEIVDDDNKRDLTGFTAKYRPFFKEERVSVQVHGGSDDHLDRVEDNFHARPKRIEFSQRNSPAEAVKASIKQDGYASIPHVRQGSEDVGYETIDDVISLYQEKDRELFEVEHRPERLTPGDRYFLTQLTLEESVDEKTKDEETDGGFPEELKEVDQGSVLEGLTIWEFEEEMETSDYPNNQAVALSLEEEILDYKDRYSYSQIDQANFLVYDRTRGEAFEIIVSEKNIRVYAKGNTTSTCFRDFYNILDEEFNSTYDIEKQSKRVKA